MDHDLIILMLSALRSAIGDSLRSAAVGTDRKYDLGRAWDHVHDAEKILTKLDACRRDMLDSTSR